MRAKGTLDMSRRPCTQKHWMPFRPNHSPAPCPLMRGDRGAKCRRIRPACCPWSSDERPACFVIEILFPDIDRARAHPLITDTPLVYPCPGAG